jgi:GTP 3',8-cyclase
MNLEASKLIDPYDRNLCYLRVSITDRCNLRCQYCCPPGRDFEWLAHEEILRYEEILRVIRVGVRLGITKVRVTGGEPLVRNGVYEFLEKLNRIEGISDISLTTNGVMLKNNIGRIKAAGINRLNISLDTLKPEKFQEITGRDRFQDVWQSILDAHEAGLHPIKINTVAMKGVNDDELSEIAELTFQYPFHMRFIEYMPIGDSPLEKGKLLLAPEIMGRLQSLGELLPVKHASNEGPAERYRFKDAIGEIGFIRPMSHHFCKRCNRLRLTSSGQLRPCLLSDRQEDLKSLLRSGCSDEDIARTFIKVIRYKPRGHHLDEPVHEAVRGRMSSIGG